MFLFIIFSDVFAKVILFSLDKTKNFFFFTYCMDFNFSSDVFFLQCDIIYIKSRIFEQTSNISALAVKNIEVNFIFLARLSYIWRKITNPYEERSYIHIYIMP